MNYRVKVYCSDCNSPRQSRDTASGKTATAGDTVAVSKSLYKKYEGRRILIEIDNGESLMPYIQDFHGDSDDVLDIYIGERNDCRCKYHPWSKRKCKFRFID